MAKDGTHAVEVTKKNWPWCAKDPSTTQHTIQKTIDAHRLLWEGKRAYECVGRTDNGDDARRVFLLSNCDGKDVARQELDVLRSVPVATLPPTLAATLTDDNGDKDVLADRLGTIQRELDTIKALLGERSTS